MTATVSIRFGSGGKHVWGTPALDYDGLRFILFPGTFRVNETMSRDRQIELGKLYINDLPAIEKLSQSLHGENYDLSCAAFSSLEMPPEWQPHYRSGFSDVRKALSLFPFDEGKEIPGVIAAYELFIRGYFTLCKHDYHWVVISGSSHVEIPKEVLK
jgi:hypothetical protein